MTACRLTGGPANPAGPAGPTSPRSPCRQENPVSKSEHSGLFSGGSIELNKREKESQPQVLTGAPRGPAGPAGPKEPASPLRRKQEVFR